MISNNSPDNWVGFHPLDTLNNQGFNRDPYFMISNTSPHNWVGFHPQQIP